MSQSDILGLILSYIYAFGLLLIVEFIGKKLNWEQHFTRKIIHIGAGMWVWGILYFFDAWYYGIIPFATFIILNYVFYRKETFKAMDKSDSTPGTVYFAISITILFLLFWRTDSANDQGVIAVAAVMAMTWGDAMASILGRKFGKHHYKYFGHSRSVEGSVAMFFFSATVIALSLYSIPGSILSPLTTGFTLSGIIIFSLVPAAAATFAEAVSPAGTDNLSVPLLTGLVLWAMMVLL